VLEPNPGSIRTRILEVASSFLKLGLTAFGGPAAHIALFRQEFVVRRKWIDDQHFLDLLGATNLIPGPNSTEMAIHLGYLRAGWAGLILGGAGFIIPAMLMVMTLAWLYGRLGTTPRVEWLLYGIKPVIIAIIIQALWSMGRKAFKNRLSGLVGMGVILLYFLNANPVILLVGAGLLVMLFENRSEMTRRRVPIIALPLAGLGIPDLAQLPFNLATLFFTFLKIGSVLYGSGYVLLAFLRSDFVTRLGWLTDRQLLDAIAIGQFTPGPVFTTATFIGYILGGVAGALLATLGIFLPSFIFVALSNPYIPRMRRSPWTASLLDGVNVASLGLMAAVTWQLGLASLVDPLTVLMAIATGVLLFRYKVNSTWLILGGALTGLIVSMIR
jgi:chromate transporter